MFELDQRIAEQLSTISLNSSVQVRCGNSNAFMVTASTMLPLMQMFEMGGVYITASRGAVEIIQAFESIGVDVSNIQFIDLLTKFYQNTKKVYFKNKLLQTIQYFNNEFKNAEGLYGSAYDADSEGVEGKYYVWSVSYTHLTLPTKA